VTYRFLLPNTVWAISVEVFRTPLVTLRLADKIGDGAAPGWSLKIDVATGEIVT